RIPLHRRVKELFYPRKVDNFIEIVSDFRSRHTEDGAIEINVLASGQLWMKSSADLQERCDPSANIRNAAGWFGHPAQDFQQSALAGAITADNADDLAGPNGK